MLTSLIANSGIQFLKYNLTIDSNHDNVKSLRFFQWGKLQGDKLTINLEYAFYDNENDVLISKRKLREDGFIDKNDKRIESEHYNVNNYEHLSSEYNAFSVNDITHSLEKFLNKWLPLPYFLKISDDEYDFGPTNWVRLKILPDEKNKNSYHFILAVDTNSKKDKPNKYSENPSFRDNEESLIYELCRDEQLLLDFCKEEYKCGWVNSYLEKIFFDEEPQKPRVFPELKYLGQYIFFIKFLTVKDFLPKIKLINETIADFANVGLVLDIGNSSTCGILYEIDVKDPFTTVRKLKIQDISFPVNHYDDPFSMRLALHKADFGMMGFQSRQFVWPSITRIGKEAERLIYKSAKNNTQGKEKRNNYSSPKRYLWDNKPSRIEWEFIETEVENPISSVYIEGISEQYKSDGSFTMSTTFGVDSNFSRQSLMNFVFLEIFANAHSQINSPEFREKHGDILKARRLTKVIITCPTGMLQHEQYILRKSAQEARLVLKRFFNNTYLESINYNENKPELDINVTPSLKDLKYKLSNIAEKRDWGYDEATCSQLVFMYAELSRKYLNNSKEYFDLYGKVRTDLGSYQKKSITIGSLDIGAGTTDLMISAYKYDDSGKCVITPVPLFWESFYLAGDDLVQKIIQQVLIEGKIKNDDHRGCTGVIQNKLQDLGELRIEEKLNDFFGFDTSRFTNESRKIRSEFVTQIAVPMALKFLQMTRDKEKDTTLTFNDFFPTLKPQSEILSVFYSHFDFRFEELIWKFSISRINEIITLVFEPLLKKIATILFAYGCDFVLLAGKPTSLHQIEELFLKFYPLPMDRLITLNNYRVGQWYPFAEQTGYFKDQKSLVAVGAMVGNLGSTEDKLGGFKINMSEMIRKMTSTSKHIGMYDNQIKEVKKIFLSPETRRGTVQISGLPVYLGSKQLSSEAYPSKPIFKFDFNNEKIKARLISTIGGDSESIDKELDRIKQNISFNMPITVTFSRDFREDREEIIIESIINSKRDEVTTSNFSLQVISLDEEKGYWLDTGEFVLDLYTKPF